MYLQSTKSVKHNAANTFNRSILKKADIGFGVFIVHSSTILPLTQSMPPSGELNALQTGSSCRAFNNISLAMPPNIWSCSALYNILS
jgi:hypothetical protein